MVRNCEPEVLEDHLRQSKTGSLEDDLACNYAQDLVILTGFGTFHGYEGVCELTELLQRQLPNAEFEYRTVLVDRKLGFLEWAARADGVEVVDGADSYLIRDDRIVAQTIHYTVKPCARSGSS
jgi:hypothetical protein